jgi:hypothetical protein
MLGSLGALASSTTKTGRHDITERDVIQEIEEHTPPPNMAD